MVRDVEEQPGFPRRTFPRVKAPVYYRAPRLIGFKRKVTNISIGGVRIYSDTPLEIGRKLEIEFALPSGTAIVADVRVAWVQELQDHPHAHYDIGLEFTRLSPTDISELQAVIDAYPEE